MDVHKNPITIAINIVLELVYIVIHTIITAGMIIIIDEGLSNVKACKKFFIHPWFWNLFSSEFL